MTKYLCRDCARPAPSKLDYDAKSGEATVTLPHADCNPRLLRFFNAESQHFSPFGR